MHRSAAKVSFASCKISLQPILNTKQDHHLGVAPLCEMILERIAKKCCNSWFGTTSFPASEARSSRCPCMSRKRTNYAKLCYVLFWTMWLGSLRSIAPLLSLFWPRTDPTNASSPQANLLVLWGGRINVEVHKSYSGFTTTYNFGGVQHSL